MTSVPADAIAPNPHIGWFSLRGRLGRIRYIAHALGAIAVVFVLMLVAGKALPLAGGLGRMLYSLIGVVLLYGFLPLRFAQLTVRRAHDFNFGGWLALLLLVPIANLAFWVIPGNRGENTYGHKPEPASAGTALLAAALFLLLVGGFLLGADHANPARHPAPQSSTSLRPYTP